MKGKVENLNLNAKTTGVCHKIGLRVCSLLPHLVLYGYNFFIFANYNSFSLIFGNKLGFDSGSFLKCNWYGTLIDTIL